MTVGAIISDQGATSLAWVCPDCHFTARRAPGQEPTPQCDAILNFDTEERCGTEMRPCLEHWRQWTTEV